MDQRRNSHPSDGSPTQATVAVCICTYRRPELLERLLGEVLSCAEHLDDRDAVHVVIVDDDPDGSAAPVAQAWQEHLRGGLRYVVTGSGNISSARNEALRRGAEAAPLLALIDDDCRPDQRWLAELLRVQREHGADLVSGHCIDIVPDHAPTWASTMTAPVSSTPDGAEVEMGFVKNLLISAEALDAYRWEFDLDFGLTGGEDAVFFYRAAADHADHRHARGAVVSEPVPIDRLTFAYQARRSLWYGSTEARTTVRTGRATRRRAAARGARHTVAGAGTVVAGIGRRQGTDAVLGTLRLLRGVGLVAGSVGIRIRHR